MEFREFLFAVFNSWVEKVGIVLTILPFIEKLPKVRAWLKEKPIVDRFSPVLWLVGGFCILWGFYGAWKDEHDKVLNQVTYMSLTQSKEAPSSVKFIENTAPYVGLMQSNDGDNPAVDATGIVILEIQDFPDPVDVDQFGSSPEVESGLFEKMKQRFLSLKIITKSYEPHEKNIVFANLGRSLTADEAKGLNERTKMLYLVGFIDWSDGAGRHEKQVCQWIKNVGQEAWSAGCQTHNGLVNASR